MWHQEKNATVTSALTRKKLAAVCHAAGSLRCSRATICASLDVLSRSEWNTHRATQDHQNPDILQNLMRHSPVANTRLDREIQIARPYVPVVARAVTERNHTSIQRGAERETSLVPLFQPNFRPEARDRFLRHWSRAFGKTSFPSGKSPIPNTGLLCSSAASAHCPDAYRFTIIQIPESLGR